MLEFDISPVIFSVGSFELRWYRLMVILAIVAIVLIASREARRVHLRVEIIYSLALWAVIAGLLGARVLHVIDQWGYYSAHPAQIVGFGGLGVYGAVLGAALATGVFALRERLSFYRLGDVIAPGAVIGQAIGRLGCVFDGCCYGLPTTLPWGITYSDPASYAPLGISMHPTQVYLMLWNLAVFVVLWSLRKRLTPVGSLFLLYLSLYALGDFGIRFLREGTVFEFGMQEAQVIGLGIMLVTLPWLAFRMLRSGRAAPAGVTPGLTVPGQED
jgi:phosphatidylglycerol---prolipoprotein diacylglyceryl transferase